MIDLETYLLLEGISDEQEIESLQRIRAQEVAIKTCHRTAGFDGWDVDLLVHTRRELIIKHNSLFSGYVETEYY